MKRLNFRFFLALIFVFGPLVSHAQKAKSPDADDAVSEAQERETAKKRLYPGGRDEEPVQVQSQLANPSRGAVEDPEPNADQD